MNLLCNRQIKRDTILFIAKKNGAPKNAAFQPNDRSSLATLQSDQLVLRAHF
jgi:hypothetical protein